MSEPVGLSRGSEQTMLGEEERHLQMLARALLLAAVDRAGDDFKYGHARERSESYDGPEGTADVDHIKSHCGSWIQWAYRGERWEVISSGGPTDRDVRRGLKAAERDGHAYVIRRSGHAQIWGLTPEGDIWLREWEAEHGPVELPEAPDRRRWRLAREEAQQSIDGARQAVRDAAAQLFALAESDDPDEVKGFFNDQTWGLERALRALHAPEPEGTRT